MNNINDADLESVSVARFDADLPRDADPSGAGRPLSDLDRIRAELRGLDDDALYTRTVETIRLGHDGRSPDGMLQKLDRVWREEALAEWTRRGKPLRYTAAMDAVRAQLRAEREANRSSI